MKHSQHIIDYQLLFYIENAIINKLIFKKLCFLKIIIIIIFFFLSSFFLLLLLLLSFFLIIHNIIL